MPVRTSTKDAHVIEPLSARFDVVQNNSLLLTFLGLALMGVALIYALRHPRKRGEPIGLIRVFALVVMLAGLALAIVALVQTISGS